MSRVIVIDVLSMFIALLLKFVIFQVLLRTIRSWTGYRPTNVEPNASETRGALMRWAEPRQQALAGLPRLC